MSQEKNEPTLFDGDALRETFAGLRRNVAEELRVLNKLVAELPDAWDHDSIIEFATAMQGVRRALLGVDQSAREASVVCSQKLRRYDEEQEARAFCGKRLEPMDAVAIMPPNRINPDRGSTANDAE